MQTNGDKQKSMWELTTKKSKQVNANKNAEKQPKDGC